MTEIIGAVQAGSVTAEVFHGWSNDANVMLRVNDVLTVMNKFLASKEMRLELHSTNSILRQCLGCRASVYRRHDYDAHKVRVSALIKVLPPDGVEYFSEIGGKQASWEAGEIIRQRLEAAGYEIQCLRVGTEFSNLHHYSIDLTYPIPTSGSTDSRTDCLVRESKARR